MRRCNHEGCAAWDVLNNPLLSVACMSDKTMQPLYRTKSGVWCKNHYPSCVVCGSRLRPRGTWREEWPHTKVACGTKCQSCVDAGIEVMPSAVPEWDDEDDARAVVRLLNEKDAQDLIPVLGLEDVG